VKITIITAVWNGETTIGTALESVRRQVLPAGVELEHIVVDGGSTDGTVERIKEFDAQGIRNREQGISADGYSFRWISEKDNGLYDAINKGIRMATGDVIGICNADDVLAEDDTIAKIAQAFWDGEKVKGRVQGQERTDSVPEGGLQAIWADIRFVNGGHNPLSTSTSDLHLIREAKATRYCTGKFFRRWMFRFGTFPAHPSTFVRKACFEKFGYYSLDYKICADFELMLRLFWKHGIRAKYLPICTHVMRTGGLSTAGFRSNRQINEEDLRALRANGYWSCLPLIYTKYFFKIWGFVFTFR